MAKNRKSEWYVHTGRNADPDVSISIMNNFRSEDKPLHDFLVRELVQNAFDARSVNPTND